MEHQVSEELLNSFTLSGFKALLYVGQLIVHRAIAFVIIVFMQYVIVSLFQLWNIFTGRQSFCLKSKVFWML